MSFELPEVLLHIKTEGAHARVEGVPWQFYGRHLLPLETRADRLAVPGDRPASHRLRPGNVSGYMNGLNRDAKNSRTRSRNGRSSCSILETRSQTVRSCSNASVCC